MSADIAVAGAGGLSFELLEELHRTEALSLSLVTDLWGRILAQLGRTSVLDLTRGVARFRDLAQDVYIDRDRDRNLVLARDLAQDLDAALALARDLTRDLAYARDVARDLALAVTRDLNGAIFRARDDRRVRDRVRDLHRSLASYCAIAPPRPICGCTYGSRSGDLGSGLDWNVTDHRRI